MLTNTSSFKGDVAQHLAVYENSDCPTPAVGPPPLVPLALQQVQGPSPAELREVLYDSKVLGAPLDPL
ncbi:MAG: hypothetical protein Q8P66_00410 [Candidatus Colwellbacteria bacterium]|nr:hypothetical protein [Candidatus Colwellbacteria bacterium]